MHRKRWISVLSAALVFPILPLLARRGPALSDAKPTSSQEPETTQQPAVPPAQPRQPATADSSSTHKKAGSHANDFLITGTVFDNHGLSLKGVRLRIRRESEKKNRWETYTNFRGEFAIRVPQGEDYEVEVQTKGFAKQSRTVDANQGTDQKVIFHMEPPKGGK
jgi:hypothetical protein